MLAHGSDDLNNTCLSLGQPRLTLVAAFDIKLRFRQVAYIRFSEDPRPRPRDINRAKLVGLLRANLFSSTGNK